MYGVVYKITNKLNGKIYIGITRQELSRRMTSHRRANTVIGKAIRKHGWENFVVEVLEECDTKEQLNEHEIFWIAELNCKVPNGYNRSDGGDGATGVECTLETREKLSAAGKGHKKSPEHRAKIGEGNRGKKQTHEARAKLSVARIGKTPYKNLLNEMNRKNILYSELAQLLGLSRITVSDKMRGKIYFTVKDVDKLVEFFALPAEYLMARDDGLSATTSDKKKSSKISITLRQNSPFKNLLREMDKRKMSYERLSKLMGFLSGVSISNRMRGKTRFTAKDKVKLEEIFGMPAEYLMARD